MWELIFRFQWLGIVLALALFSVSACSVPRQQPEKGLDTRDPFADPFFTQVSEWDASVLQQSEVLAENEVEAKEPESFLERTEGVIFGTLVTGAALAQLALPFLGLGF
jgi:hypothetical protein